MFEFLHLNPEDAINILKTDHDTVKDIFDKFENADNIRSKKKLAAEAIMELRIHATIEEEIFYPSLRGKQKVDQDLLNEADEEHHVAKLLIAELAVMDGSEDHWEAKFTVLAENIRHHIKEEEGDLFPQARKTDVDFSKIGEMLLKRKEQLKKNGVPANAEELMIASHKKGSGDSSAKAAKRKAPKLVKSTGVTKTPSKKPVATKKPVSAKASVKKTSR